MTDATKTVLTEEEQHKLFWARGEDVLPWWAVTIDRLTARLALAEAVVDAAREAMPVTNRSVQKNDLRAALADYDAGTR